MPSEVPSWRMGARSLGRAGERKKATAPRPQQEAVHSHLTIARGGLTLLATSSTFRGVPGT